MPPIQDGVLAGPSKEKRQEASTASGPSARSKVPFRYRELLLLREISWVALQGAGEKAACHGDKDNQTEHTQG